MFFYRHSFAARQAPSWDRPLHQLHNHERPVRSRPTTSALIPSELAFSPQTVSRITRTHYLWATSKCFRAYHDPQMTQDTLILYGLRGFALKSGSQGGLSWRVLRPPLTSR